MIHVVVAAGLAVGGWIISRTFAVEEAKCVCQCSCASSGSLSGSSWFLIVVGIFQLFILLALAFLIREWRLARTTTVEQKKIQQQLPTPHPSQALADFGPAAVPGPAPIAQASVVLSGARKAPKGPPAKRGLGIIG